ncbi:DUF885 domain-containing protein [Kordiimonas aquimaris]|uniref:DUF885 domain-containing protein n=1 Tax=Kordiimonas aquimaris TaxID=707591 RepID=UPI0021CF949A|nr:DUF885 domain-containing protein [Kordiimonas aquimaris]
MKIKHLISATVLLCAFAGRGTFADTPSPFDTLLKDHWENVLSEQVFFRRDPDVFRMDGPLPDFSAAGRLRREKFNETVIKRLEVIDPETLSATGKINYKLFKYERLAERESYRQPDHLFPLNIYAGFHTYFAEAPAKMSFLSTHDYDKYIVSLADFPRYSSDFTASLREAISKGWTHYCKSFESYETTISRSIFDDITQSEFYAPIANFPSAIPADKQAEYKEKISILIRDVVIPEYRKFYAFFTEEYMPSCRNEVGITALNGGSDYYKYLINFHTTTGMSAQEIHDLGLSEVARIRAEMDKIIEKVGFIGSFKEFLDSLRNNPKSYASSPRDLLEKAAFIAQRMEGELPKWFTVLPRGTYSIKASPGGGAYYVAPAGDGKTSGTYYIGANNYLSEPLYNLEALTYHEAVPGHHFQGAIAQELDMPEFRKTLYHSAYGEGWGLYAESLGVDAGFYEDPYSDFGRLTYEMWRACRLVVDTGMHAFGWSRQKAINYLLENTALSEPDSINQIDRYITWPAQALSYKIGELRIQALRDKAEHELGDKFDIRRFHDTVVGQGSLPIAVLEEIVGEWINAEKS